MDNQEPWYIQLKSRQQSAQDGFRLPVLKNYANDQANMLRIAERNRTPYDLSHILRLASQDSGEYYRNIVNKPYQFDPALIERVKNAAPAEGGDDADSVVSDTLSVDEPLDPEGYKDAKASAKESASNVSGLRKASDSIKAAIHRLEHKEEHGGLTPKETSKLKVLKERAIDMLVDAYKKVPKAQADLKAVKRSKVREVLRSHLDQSSGPAKLLASTALKITTDGDLWWKGARVAYDKLSRAEAQAIQKKVLHSLASAEPASEEAKKLTEFNDALQNRITTSSQRIRIKAPVKVSDSLYMNVDGVQKVIMLDNKEVVTNDDYVKVLERLEGDESKNAKKIREYVKRKLEKSGSGVARQVSFESAESAPSTPAPKRVRSKTVRTVEAAFKTPHSTLSHEDSPAS